MINKVSFSIPNYSHNKVGFQGLFGGKKKEPQKPLTPEEIADKAAKLVENVDLQDPDDIEDFGDRFEKEKPEDLERAAVKLRERANQTSPVDSEKLSWAAGYLDNIAKALKES